VAGDVDATAAVAAAAAAAGGGAAATTMEDIYKFISKAYKLAKFSPECNILALVLVNRCIGTTHIPLTVYNWRLFLLTALLVAQKVWDDRALSNIDFPTVWAYAADVRKHGTLDVRAVNQLERKLLELLHYNVTVAGSLYARYYFELRTLATENKLPFHLPPLSKEDARRLEATSASKRDEFRAGHAWGVGADYSRSRTLAALKPSSEPSASPAMGRAVLS